MALMRGSDTSCELTLENAIELKTKLEKLIEPNNLANSPSTGD
ncbi:hypothetical protein BH09VER1_BH09VER1_37450 [soil metagenome]